jgi:flavin-binding protein dodecin
MANETYVKTEVVGTSSMSVSDAIASAIATASRSLRNLEWFGVVSVRGKLAITRSSITKSRSS